ncbi:MAG: hypothetical protein IKO36_05475 [Bacteroidaceae bacterium]|nr:hypothetical protein [Bacteroidaceae bacterium]
MIHDFNDFINESKTDGVWCLWDYKQNGEHKILIWKGDGMDQSDVTDIDKNGKDLLNVTFDEIVSYCEQCKKSNNVDKWHLDFSNANLSKIPTIFK